MLLETCHAGREAIRHPEAGEGRVEQVNISPEGPRPTGRPLQRAVSQGQEQICTQGAGEPALPTPSAFQQTIWRLGTFQGPSQAISLRHS